MPEHIQRTSKVSTGSSEKAGLPPGTLVHVGERKIDKARITVFHYDEAQYQVTEAESIEETFRFRDEPPVAWINVDGIHDLQIIERIGEHFGLHPLLLEDVAHTGQRPKLDDHEDYLFLTLKMLRYDGAEDRVESEQVSLFLGSNFAISFQESVGDAFDTVRERIRTGKGRIRRKGADYLAYALVDAVVDSYFTVLEATGEKFDLLEEELLADPTPVTLQVIHKLRGDTMFLRRSIWPLRDVVNRLGREESPLVQESTRLYLRDVYDHTIQVIDTLETYRDMLSVMLDVYLSSVSNRMNEIMKVLTVIATIFIPITFVASIYGMNFVSMPELRWPWGYPTALLLMLTVAALLVAYFRKKGWV